ncbi:MAG: hypothetical protein DRP74_01910 [Candidatus Omnitrophota bacterium]|nr:MAG: hypothetical protein DRP74_01910 [Candidatus Omnitrophota bacterium]
MRILILGYSKIVRKRVLPALLKIPEISSIDIASESCAAKVSLEHKSKGAIYDDYDKAFSESRAQLIYISTINSMHNRLVSKALRRGLHTIVDKPAFTSFEAAKKSIDFAKKSKLCLAEATVYAYHQQIQSIFDIFKRAKDAPRRLTAVFSFPPMEPGNFRYYRQLGGGALWDLGPYAVSLGRVFFNHERPIKIFSQVCSKGGKNKIDISFSVSALYSEGRSMVGNFGFDTGYRNHLNILGQDLSVSLDRVFSTPADLENEIRISQGRENSIMKVPKSDSFLNFLKSVLSGIRLGSFSDFSKAVLSDALALDTLRKVAQGG